MHPDSDFYGQEPYCTSSEKGDSDLLAKRMNLPQTAINGPLLRVQDIKAQVEPPRAKDAPSLKSYADVRALLNGFMKSNKGPIDFAPHGAFWNEMSHTQFIEGNVPEVRGPAGKPLKILLVGNSRESNIIMALRGAKGSIFDRDAGSIGRMPPTGPFMSDEEISRLADWIDRGCPDGL